VAGQIDLSIGPNAGLTSVLCAGLMSYSGWSLVPAVVVAILVGLLIGVINGILVAKIGIGSIIATLGMSSVLSAIVLAYSGGLSITTGISTELIGLGSGKWLGLPKLFYFLAGTALVVWYLLEKTPAGKNLYAIGSSSRAALLVGISVSRQTFRSLVLAGGIAGCAGVLLVAAVGAGSPQLGANYTLPAVAAAFLGATSINPGRYNVWGTVAAVFFLAVAVNGLTLLGAAPWVNELFDGAALIVGVGLGVYAGLLRKRPGRRKSPTHATPADAPAAVARANAEANRARS
jgi:ribose transport system permease protein